MIFTINPTYLWSDKHNDYILIRHDGQYEATPVMLYDRQISKEAEGAEKTAGTTASNEGATAQTIQGRLMPFYEKEMTAQNLFNPGQVNQLMTTALAGSGGATAGIEGQSKLDAARTGNTSAQGATMDDIARQQQKVAAGTSENVQAENIMGAKQLNQQGAAGMANLYGADTDAMLKSMGIQTGDINAQTDAQKVGWLQDMDQTIAAASGLITAVKK